MEKFGEFSSMYTATVTFYNYQKLLFLNDAIFNQQFQHFTLYFKVIKIIEHITSAEDSYYYRRIILNIKNCMKFVFREFKFSILTA